MREFKVINENNFYYEKHGLLSRETEHEVILKIDVRDWDSFIPFDKSEVEEVLD